MNKTFLPFIMGQLRPVAISLLTALMLVGGGSFAWGDDIYYDGSTVLSVTGWTTSGSISYSSYGTPRYMMISNGSTGTLISNDNLSLSTYRKLCFSARKLNSSSDGFYLKVQYSSDGGTNWIDYSTFTDDLDDTNNYKDFEIDLVGTYKIKLECSGVRLQVLKLSINEPHPTPNSFVVSDVSETTAEFSWTNGNNSATSVEIAYSTDQYFTPGTNGIIVSGISTTSPAKIDNLTDGATYYAAIRAIYSDGESDWSDKIRFSPGINVLANNGTNSTSYAPFTGNSVSTLNQSQFIIPSNQLTDIQNRQITSLTFYTSASSLESGNWGDATFNIYLKNTTSSTFSSTFDSDWGTLVCENAKLTLNAHEMIITFDEGKIFKYTTNNLMIGFEQTASGTNSSSVNWVTNNGTYGNTLYRSNPENSPSKTGALPKVRITTASITLPATIGKNGFTTFASPRALDLRKDNLPDGLTAYKAESVDGTKIRFTSLDQTVPANTGVLLAGTANTPYDIPVVASGDAVSGNLFHVNSTGGTFAADANYTYYGLKKATGSSDPLIFATFDPSTVAIPSNKAYLKVADGGSARQLTCVFDDEATGISATLMNSEERIVNSIYNLAGQRVAQPTKGLYIKNGRKVIVK